MDVKCCSKQFRAANDGRKGAKLDVLQTFAGHNVYLTTNGCNNSGKDVESGAGSKTDQISIVRKGFSLNLCAPKHDNH